MGSGSVNGVDTQRFHKNKEIVKQSTAFRVKHHIPLNAFVFGYVGRLVGKRGSEN